MTIIATDEHLERLADMAVERALDRITARFDLVPIPWETAPQLARRMGKDAKTIRAMYQRGEIEGREIGGKLMYRRKV